MPREFKKKYAKVVVGELELQSTDNEIYYMYIKK